MASLNIQAFPIHHSTFQGTAADEDLSTKSYDIVHADDDGSITASFPGGDVTVNLAKGEDVTVAGALSVTSTMSVKIS